jgi:thiol-disulfide isomerase/thioredoxin
MNRMIVAVLAALVALPVISMTPRTFAAATSSAKEKPAKPLHVSKGTPVKLADLCVPGKTMVFDFYSDYCGPCVQVAPALEQLHQTRADIMVVKVDINRPGIKGIDWKSPVAQQYGLRSIPHFKVYGPDGKLLAEDRPPQAAARQMVMGWLKSSK